MSNDLRGTQFINNPWKTSKQVLYTLVTKNKPDSNLKICWNGKTWAAKLEQQNLSGKIQAI